MAFVWWNDWLDYYRQMLINYFSLNLNEKSEKLWCF
jgi:hypothetical protein